MKQFERKIGFPKLVVAGDGYADRSIENIVNVEVINLTAAMPADKSAELFSSSFTVSGDVETTLDLKGLSGFPRKDVRAVNVGEGRGYHGIDDYSGVPFKDILNRAGISPKLASIFLVSAPDGYRSTFSYGEIFLIRVEEILLIADTRSGKEIKEGGKFILVPAGDLMADRDVKSVQKIEVIDLSSKPRVTFIGIGSGDSDLITMEAVRPFQKRTFTYALPI